MATEEHTEQPPATTARSLVFPTSISPNHPNYHPVRPANPSDEKAEPVLPSTTLDSELNASTHVPSSSSLAENGAVKEQPTEQDLKECRHVKNSLSRNVWFVAVLGLCERFAYYGVTVMFQNYIQNHRHDPLRPGALGLGESIAGVMNNVFTLYCLVAPIGAAIVADTWLGRFRTLCLASYIYIVGLIILITTSVPAALERGAGLPGLIVSMVIFGTGVGGVKATIGPFIADQCTDELYTIKYTESGEKVIVDREATVEYIFNIYYWCVNAGALSGIATTFLEKDVGYWAAFLMPMSVFAFGIIVFHLNRRQYVDQRPERKNILPIAFRAMWYGARGGAKMDAAKPTNVQRKYGKSVPWSASFIEELKSGLTATRAFVAFIIYWLCQTQMSTNLISQAANMASHGIPNDLLTTINSVAVVIILPIMQHGVNPLLRRYHVPFPPISRMTVGFIIEAAAMAYVAGIQKLLYGRPPCYSHPRQCRASDGGKIPNDVHVLTQVPVYVLEGLGETFSSPAGYEYAYTKAPQSMKTVVQAAFQLSSAAGSALALALAPTYSDPKLLIVLSTLAGCMFLDACVFHVVFRKEARRRVPREDEEDGHRGEGQSVDDVDTIGETRARIEENGTVNGARGISKAEKRQSK